MSNRIKHPEAWEFFEDQARNITGTEFEKYGKYRIPIPNLKHPVEFVYADDPGPLWGKFIVEWYKEDYNSPSIQGKIQFIANNF